MCGTGTPTIFSAIRSLMCSGRDLTSLTMISLVGVRQRDINDQLLLFRFLLDIFQDICHLPLLGREKRLTVTTFLVRPASRSVHIFHFLFSFLQHGDVKNCSIKSSHQENSTVSKQYFRHQAWQHQIAIPPRTKCHQHAAQPRNSTPRFPNT